jgi:hypothetical protein
MASRRKLSAISGKEGHGRTIPVSTSSTIDPLLGKGVVCVFSIFNAGGSVCGCMCVYTHTHTHTAQMGYLDVSPGVGMRHMEGPKNPDGLNLGIYIFVYVYKVHLCMYMPGGGMRSWINCFFL